MSFSGVFGTSAAVASAWTRGSSAGSMRTRSTPRPSARRTPSICPTATPATVTGAPTPGRHGVDGVELEVERVAVGERRLEALLRRM